MIDYDATLRKFFEEILEYLDKCAKKAKDKHVQQSVFDAIWAVRTIADYPKMYADYNVRVKANLEQHSIVDGFMAGTRDNSVYQLYSKVLNCMGELDSEFSWKREEAQKVLLNAKRAIEYKNSTSILKDFVFPFRSRESFAVKVKQK